METWETDGINANSVQKAVDMGDILPELPVSGVGDTVKVRILTTPKKLVAKDGKDFYVMDVSKLDSKEEGEK